MVMEINTAALEETAAAAIIEAIRRMRKTFM
jgi:hypothetical protein